MISANISYKTGRETVVISWREYEKLTRDEVKGRKARNLREFRTGMYDIRIGSVLEVIHKRGGYDLRGRTCASCGVSVYVRKVKPVDLEWVRVPYPQECMCEQHPELTALDCHVHWDNPDHFAEVCAEPERGETHECHGP